MPITLLRVADRWTVVGDMSPGPRVRVGPEGDTLPAGFTARYLRPDDPLELQLTCKMENGRYAIKKVLVNGRENHSISPRDMTTIELGRAIYLAAEMFADPIRSAEDRSGHRATRSELSHVAAVYAWEYAAWGKARQTVMDIWKLPRSTANSWIRRARDLFPEMPGEDGER